MLISEVRWKRTDRIAQLASSQLRITALEFIRGGQTAIHSPARATFAHSFPEFVDRLPPPPEPGLLRDFVGLQLLLLRQIRLIGFPAGAPGRMPFPQAPPQRPGIRLRLHSHRTSLAGESFFCIWFAFSCDTPLPLKRRGFLGQP